MTTSAVAIVIGRAGSRGFPNKNVAPLHGRPLVAHTVETARAARSVADVILSTDGAEIARAGAEAGARIIRRPAELASDVAPVDAPVRHALRTLELDHSVVVILYANVPVRPAGLIDRAIGTLIETGADSVQSYAPVGKHHPNWMVRIDGRGAVSPYAETKAFRRQDLEPLFLPDGGVIVVRRAALEAAAPDEPASFFGRDRRAIINEPGAVVDIDEPFDLLVAEQKLSTRQQEGAPARALDLPGNT